jgi:hypothetical protein
LSEGRRIAAAGVETRVLFLTSPVGHRGMSASSARCNVRQPSRRRSPARSRPGLRRALRTWLLRPQVPQCDSVTRGCLLVYTMECPPAALLWNQWLCGPSRLTDAGDGGGPPTSRLEVPAGAPRKLAAEPVRRRALSESLTASWSAAAIHPQLKRVCGHLEDRDMAGSRFEMQQCAVDIIQSKFADGPCECNGA